MKRIICIFVCLIMLLSSVFTSSAEDETDFECETHPSGVGDFVDSARPPYAEINNISLTFYIVNGKAYASYSVSAKTAGVTVNVKLEKQTLGFLWTDAGKEQTEKTDKKYISGSYSAAVKDSGTYRIVLEIKVNGETDEKEAVYEYDKTKVYGDAVADGVIRANDARLILRYSAKLEKYTEKQKILCDIDSNGNITAADARITLRLAAKLI